MGAVMKANEPPFMQIMYQVVDKPVVASTSLDQITSGESSRWPRAPESSVKCATMAILNIPYTYPKNLLQRDIDQLNFPYTGFHCPRDRKHKDHNRGFAFVKFATSEVAHKFQQLFHHRLLSYPGSPSKNVSVLPSGSTTSYDQMHLVYRAEYSGASSETKRWPPAAPPGIHQGWHASYNQSSGVVHPRASPVPPPMFEDGTVVLRRFSV